MFRRRRIPSFRTVIKVNEEKLKKGDSPQRTQRTQRKRLTKTKVRRKGKLMNLFSVIFAEKRQDRKKIDGKDISSFVFPLRDSLFESKKTRNFLPFASYLSFAFSAFSVSSVVNPLLPVHLCVLCVLCGESFCCNASITCNACNTSASFGFSFKARRSCSSPLFRSPERQ